MSDKGRVRALIREAEAAGLEVTTTGGGHLRFRGRGVLIFAPSTPGDIRACDNARAKLRRALAEQEKHSLQPKLVG